MSTFREAVKRPEIEEHARFAEEEALEQALRNACDQCGTLEAPMRRYGGKFCTEECVKNFSVEYEDHLDRMARDRDCEQEEERPQLRGVR